MTRLLLICVACLFATGCSEGRKDKPLARAGTKPWTVEVAPAPLKSID